MKSQIKGKKVWEEGSELLSVSVSLRQRMTR